MSARNHGMDYKDRHRPAGASSSASPHPQWTPSSCSSVQSLERRGYGFRTPSCAPAAAPPAPPRAWSGRAPAGRHPTGFLQPLCGAGQFCLGPAAAGFASAYEQVVKAVAAGHQASSMPWPTAHGAQKTICWSKTRWCAPSGPGSPWKGLGTKWVWVRVGSWGGGAAAGCSSLEGVHLSHHALGEKFGVCIRL
jgi:hypothetical protein